MKRFAKKAAVLLLCVSLAIYGAGCNSTEHTEVTDETETVAVGSVQETAENAAEESTDEAVQTTTAATTTTKPAEVVTVEVSAAETEEEMVSAEETAEAATSEAAVTTAATTTTVITTTTAVETTTQPEEVIETKYVALTFDDGPNTTTTAEVLDMLEKYDITASFFLIGTNINDESAKVVKRAYDMGCEINNHSKSHPYMNEMSVDEIIEQFTYTDDLIYEITGERSKFFRPPYIAVSQDMLDNIDVPFISGIGCNDWDDKVTVERRHAMILRQVKDGSIILLHDAEGNSKTVEALDTLIPEMLAQGYKFVTVSELFETYSVEISGSDEKIYSNVHQTSMY